MLALKLQEEARQAEGSWSSWQEAKLLAKLVARLKREGLRGRRWFAQPPPVWAVWAGGAVDGQGPQSVCQGQGISREGDGGPGAGAGNCGGVRE